MLSQLNPAQRLVILAGAWAAALQVWFPPYVEVRGTLPAFDLDPPGVPRCRRVVYASYRPPGLPDAQYYPDLIGVYPDEPLLYFQVVLTGLAAAAACRVAGVVRGRRPDG